MIDLAHLCNEAIRLYPIDPAAAQLLQQAGDEIQQLRAQRQALMAASAAVRVAEKVPHA